MGRIGQAVARRAKAFGLQIHYHNRKPVSADIEHELEATYWESLDQMLARMDIVSINCPHTPATYHLLSARRLKLMKPSAYIVNTARGEVIDENTLARMLEAGQLSGAGLDVFEHEPAVNPEAAEAQERGAAAAHGLGHDRRPHRHGREGHHQHQDLRRRPQTAGPRHPGDALETWAGHGNRAEPVDHIRAQANLHYGPLTMGSPHWRWPTCLYSLQTRLFVRANWPFRRRHRERNRR